MIGNKVFGLRLKEIKTIRKTTLPKIANQLGLQAFVVRDWAAGHGEPGIRYLIRLSNLLNVSVDYLLGLSDDVVIHNKTVQSGSTLVQD